MRYVFFICCFFSLNALQAQYYYKDIISTKETAEGLKAYLVNKVTSVRITSYDADGTRNEEMQMVQSFDPAARKLTTVTRSGKESAPTVLISWLNESGAVTRTMDSGVAMVSITAYQYNADGQLQSINTASTDSAQRAAETEVHNWEYNGNQVKRMIRIKNGRDTTIVQFKYDAAGNISEEQSIRRGVASEPVYYYYDSQNRLTDIVRYNSRARRLLPEYMFEYNAANRVIQRITVPSTNASRYLIWRYQYDDRGLKTKEVVYDRFKQLNGKVEYQYTVQ